MYAHKRSKKWQERWEEARVFEVSEDEQKKLKAVRPGHVSLSLFERPPCRASEGYTATDIYCRYAHERTPRSASDGVGTRLGCRREVMRSKEGTHPAETTRKNIQTFKRQLKSLGFSYDWSKELNTSSPDYYRWTQWLFLQLYKQGLAYKKEGSGELVRKLPNGACQ